MKKHKLLLKIKILQRGELQLEKDFKVNQKTTTKKIVFGSHPNCDLQIPFCTINTNITIFNIDHKKIWINLYPHMEGLVNNGTTTKEIKEFITPLGAITSLATESEPIKTELSVNSWGLVNLLEFTLLFKLERENNKISPSLGYSSARSTLFKPTFTNTGPETLPFSISLLLVGVMLSGVLFWLNGSEIQVKTSSNDFEKSLSLVELSPRHFRIAPLALQEKFDLQNPKMSVIGWLKNIKKTLTTHGDIYSNQKFYVKNMTNRYKKILEEYYTEYEFLKVHFADQNIILDKPFTQPHSDNQQLTISTEYQEELGRLRLGEQLARQAEKNFETIHE